MRRLLSSSTWSVNCSRGRSITISSPHQTARASGTASEASRLCPGVVRHCRRPVRALKFGLFHQEGKRFPAYIRFSNARVQDDQHPGGHAMAIKLMGVSGDKLLPGEEHAETHDFLLLDSPVFFIKNAIEFASFDAALLAREKSWLGLLSLAGYFATHIWEALILLKRLASKISTNPLETKYWSATPYKLGDGAVKYFARPRRHGPPIAAKTPSVDQPRHAMKRTLEHSRRHIRLLHPAPGRPGEHPDQDATHNWDESVSSYEKVATIHIPRKSLTAMCRWSSARTWPITRGTRSPTTGPLAGSTAPEGSLRGTLRNEAQVEQCLLPGAESRDSADRIIGTASLPVVYWPSVLTNLKNLVRCTRISNPFSSDVFRSDFTPRRSISPPQRPAPPGSP